MSLNVRKKKRISNSAFMSIDIANNKCEMVESIYSSPNILSVFYSFPRRTLPTAGCIIPENMHSSTIAPRKIDPLPT